ncbi:MAG TPA: hypothetical protein VNM43_05535 [Dehalococcoidia bacterium]|nr:hypothetical protein [Dehalococcoidia bacterium]
MRPPEAPALLLVAAHLPAMSAMPRRFLAARRAERALRGLPGCALVHRWVSRRSILLTSWWADAGAAQAALGAPEVQALLDLVRRTPGADVWTAVYVAAAREGPQT